ncbi:hemerythrin domain-containing protein [Streptomyces sp. NPDC006879]|uniref:hemerythrin domain-containing protein n=1 Tax=Streptomyces sp. NPDC006879 TaxID=3364767 RepID=UPI0036BE9597
MSGHTFKHDMTMMFAIHDALRRELEQIAQITARTTDDPWQILRTAVGWQMFKDYLHVHHGAEDTVLWPAIRQAVADRPAELAVIEAMDAEHEAIDPGLAAVDAALADREGGPERLGEIIGRLVAGLGGHLRHEEDEALALVDAYATDELLRRFGAEHGTRIGAAGNPAYLPWLLDGAGPRTTAAVLGRLPEPLLAAYHEEWQPAYVKLDRWGVKNGSAIG